MPGNRHEYRGAYVTPRVLYREIKAVDTDPAASDIPEIDNGDSDEGKDARFFISVLLLDGITAATVQLWMKADQAVRSPFVDSSSSSSVSDVEKWVLVKSEDLTDSQLVVATNIPPGVYKVLVTSITGAGTVRLLEQHAA